MLIALLLAAAAWPADPKGGSGHLALLGGLDAWSGEAGPVAEARIGAWTVTSRDGSTLVAGMSGAVEALPSRDLAWLDAWTGEVRIRGRGRMQPGMALLGRGGLLMDPSWGEVALGATLRLGVDEAWLEATAGPLARGGSGITTAGGLASLAAGAGGRRFRMSGQASARAFAAEDFPPWALDADLQVAGGGRIQTWATAGVTWVPPSDILDPVAGLVAPDTPVLRGGIGAMVPLGSHLALYAEAGAEIGVGAVSYTRERAMAGLVVQFGRGHPRREVVQPATGVRFTIDAPRARSVALAGTFTQWAPVTVERSPDGEWTLVLPLPPGEYEYTWIVDGEPRTPEESVRRRPDGFGGENGVVVVAP